MAIKLPLHSVAEDERETVDAALISAKSAMKPADYIYGEELESWITVVEVFDDDSSFTFTATNGNVVVAKGTSVIRRKRAALLRERATSTRVVTEKREPDRHPRGATQGFPRQDEYPARPDSST
ncbi:hypothetical protein [Mycolicibacterium komossense]|uniref:Uncharacterized protein n=1 Tax=Mycolicibacterium komossense TaxID=1779 RepID=A0ABT3CI08_9MYCO|nr:hypothetical protein [Mycolicibacterium komossense]MCV7229090.1 hypothetical protein [Mycolicibacterium komossense]